jgi:hypothetical protein
MLLSVVRKFVDDTEVGVKRNQGYLFWTAYKRRVWGLNTQKRTASEIHVAWHWRCRPFSYAFCSSSSSCSRWSKVCLGSRWSRFWSCKSFPSRFETATYLAWGAVVGLGVREVAGLTCGAGAGVEADALLCPCFIVKHITVELSTINLTQWF